VHQAEIARVFEADGPFTSVYLDTEGDVEQAADRVHEVERGVPAHEVDVRDMPHCSHQTLVYPQHDPVTI
jgi:hypothetical protein